MQVRVSSKILSKHITKISSVIVLNPILPALENLLFCISKNEIKITASDMRTSVSTTIKDIECTGYSKPLQICVTAKLFLDIIKSLAEQQITLDIDLSSLFFSIKTENGQYKLGCESAENFPIIEPSETLGEITLNSEDFNNMISTVIVTASRDEMKPSLNGVYFEISESEKKLILVSTDGFKLAKYTKSNLSIIGNNINFIVHRKTISIIMSILGSLNQQLRIFFTKNHIIINTEGFSILSCLLGEKFPDYKAVIQVNNSRNLFVDRILFLESLKRTALFVNKSTKHIKLSFNENNIEIIAQDIDFNNEAKEVIPCEYDSPSINMGFNVVALLELVACIKHDSLKMEFSEKNKACFIKPSVEKEEEDILLLIMPMVSPDE